MVSEKTSATKTKVAKKSTAKTKIKNDEKNVTTEKVTKTKTVKEKKETPVKIVIEEKSNNNIANPVAEVLLIKAKNEEKQLAKANKKSEKKEAKIKAKEAANEVKAAYEKGHSKVISEKKLSIKENITKAEARKFVEKKEEVNATNKFDNSFFLAWLDGYKKIFDYKTRSSRYEFWAFILPNLILSIALSFALYFTYLNIGNFMKEAKICYNMFYAIQIVAALSLSVRRLHDIGVSGWRNFYKPTIYSLVILITLSLVMKYFTLSEQVAALLGLIGFLIFVVFLYYALKTSVAVSFFESDNTTNKYGEPRFTDKKYSYKTIRYITWHILILSVLLYIFQALLIYLGIFLRA